MLRAVMIVIAEYAGVVVVGQTIQLLLHSAFGGLSAPPLVWNIGGIAATAVYFGYVYHRDRGNLWIWGKPSPKSLEWLFCVLVGLALARGLPGLMLAASRVCLLFRPWESAALEACLLAPLREEILYRGYLLRRLSALTGLWPALVISGLLFGMGHPDPLRTAAWGVAVGYLYSPLGTGRLAAVIVLHMAWNLTVSIRPWIPMGH